MNTTQIEPEILEKATLWTQPPFDENTRHEVATLIKQNPDQLKECFYKDLEFGTGGMRGIMGPGTNRINAYTLGMATHGFSQFLKKQHFGKQISVAIAHDSRHNSRPFARQVAEVFASNGILVYLFEDLRPTPELSFAIRHYGCAGGVVLTASHNPKEYNGYKVYGNDGAQLVPPFDKMVIDEIRKVSVTDIRFEHDPKLIQVIGKNTDRIYLDALKNLSLGAEGRENFKIVFTPLHGTTGVLLPQAFREWGFDAINVEEQMIPDGDFPTVESPNPEEASALKMAVELATKTHADLVIGNDPDGDRVGIAVRNESGKIQLLNGNETAAALLYYVLLKRKENGLTQPNDFIAQTIVTTDLLEKIATHFGVKTYYCYTGFKWIAEIIREKEGEENYVAGGEESYGYLVGDFVRDKDAIGASLMLAEMAAWCKSQDITVTGFLKNIYKELGCFQEKTISLTLKGIKGAEEIAQRMKGLRQSPPAILDGEKVAFLRDYQSQTEKNLLTGETKEINMPPSNVIQVETESGNKFTARPSGTEPKIKFYFSVRMPFDEKNNFEKIKTSLLEKMERMAKELKIK